MTKPSPPLLPAPQRMPKRRAVWSSWVYTADTRTPRKSIGVSYWMNRLQNIPERDPLFVELFHPHLGGDGAQRVDKLPLHQRA